MTDNSEGPRATNDRSLAVVLMLGDPDFATTLSQVDIAVEAGVNLVELGIPIADPFLDSSTMKASMGRALGQCAELPRYLEILHTVRARHPALFLEVMIYRSTLDKIGLERYAEALERAAVNATLVADAARQSQAFRDQLDEALLPRGILPIRFIPEPDSPDLVADARENARGFVVVQTVTGPDGEREQVLDANALKLERLRAAGVALPLVLAYGIVTPAQVRRAIELGADGVLIGSAVLDTAYRSLDELRSLLADYRAAAVRPPAGRSW